MARGNISSLGIGSGSYKDYMAKQVSLSISRNQYRANMSDERLQLIRNAVYRLVSNWPSEDKMAILTEYGDGGVLKKNYSQEDLNKALTESIIIHLDPTDLEQLYAQVTAEARNMSRDIKKIEKKRKKLEEALKNEKSDFKKKQLENKLLMFDKKYSPRKFYGGGGTYIKP